MSLADIARQINPLLRGWIEYYGRYTPSALHAVFRHVNQTLLAWATARGLPRERFTSALAGRRASLGPGRLARPHPVEDLHLLSFASFPGALCYRVRTARRNAISFALSSAAVRKGRPRAARSSATSSSRSIVLLRLTSFGRAVSNGATVASANKDARRAGEIPALPRAGESVGHRILGWRAETCFGKLTQLPLGLQPARGRSSGAQN